MDILPITSLIQIAKANRHEDQQPQKRQQPRKKDDGRSRSVYTPDGHLTEEAPPIIDLVG